MGKSQHSDFTINVGKPHDKALTEIWEGHTTVILMYELNLALHRYRAMIELFRINTVCVSTPKL